jgi:predicted nucleic acid-binding protein
VTAKVIDASAAVAILFDELTREAVIEEIGDAELFAPTLLPFEVGNACMKKIKARPAELHSMLGGFAAYQDLTVQEVSVDRIGVATLAQRERLSFYDAAYLWLARELGAELVTLDEKLAKAARA